MRPNHFLMLAALLGLSQCRKDPAPTPPPVNQVDLLPSATQTGRRTFGCLVNGQPWTPAGNPFAGPLFTAEYDKQHLRLIATRGIVSNGATTLEAIQIEIDSISGPKKFILSSDNSSFTNYENVTAKCIYYTDATHPAAVIITRLDLVNRIVSGTFDFTLETPGCGKVTVTEGRFDSPF